jgi:hypothetical protein
MALAVGLALAAPVPAQDEAQPAKAKAGQDALAALLDKLHSQEVQLREGTNINEIPLFELLQDLSKRYDVPFVINEESFKAENEPNIKEKKPTLSATQLRGLTLHQFLTTTLDSMGATYMVKGKTIEIVHPVHAARLTKTAVDQIDDVRKMLAQPLVSFVAKEKPLNEAIAQLADRYDLSVVVSPQAGDARTGFVTARLLNVPAETALELLATQCDLRVVRKGTAFLITSKDHADGMFNEQMDRERAKIELEKFRAMPVGPPPKPEAPPPQPKPAEVQPLILKGDLLLPLQVKPQPKPEK